MHKGYTLNYFIDFFKNIPDHRWTTGVLHKEGTVQMCAMGHALAGHEPSLEKCNALSEGDNEGSTARSNALDDFLGGRTISINDAGKKSPYYKLGSTPRGRILKALRNRKRYGNVFGKLGND